MCGLQSTPKKPLAHSPASFGNESFFGILFTAILQPEQLTSRFSSFCPTEILAAIAICFHFSRSVCLSVCKIAISGYHKQTPNWSFSPHTFILIVRRWPTYMLILHFTTYSWAHIAGMSSPAWHPAQILHCLIIETFVRNCWQSEHHWFYQRNSLL